MRKLTFVLITLIYLTNNAFSQQTHLSGKTEKVVYPMVIFQPNEPQSILDAGATTKTISFQIFASESYKESFSGNILKNNTVISCKLDKKAKAGATINMDLSPEVDFDYLKNLLKENGVMFVSVEDTLLNINNWRAFTTEEMKKINQLNQVIKNIVTKRNWVLENEQQKQLALSNGWMDENDMLLKNAKEAKAEYIRQILK